VGLLAAWLASAAPLFGAELAAPLETPPPATGDTIGGIPKKPATTPAGWLNSLPEAKRRAAAENKLILANFTGSDWCGFCQALMDDVFSKPEFHRWAAQKVILLYVDFPQLHFLPPEIQEQNATLGQQFGIQGVPQIYFLDATGEPITNLGYLPVSATQWITLVEMLLPKRLLLAKPLASFAATLAAENLPLLVVNAEAPLGAALLTQAEIANNSAENFRVVKIGAALWRQWFNAEPVAASLFARDGKTLATISVSRSESLLKRDVTLAKTAAAQILAALPAADYHGEWVKNYPQALKIARRLHRPLVLNFAGADAGEATQKIRREIWETADFRTYAAQKLVLVDMEFPPLDELVAARERGDPTLLEKMTLAAAYGIAQLPATIIVRPDGEPIIGFTFTDQTPPDYVQMIKRGAEKADN
jgi:protein disulfide-isomerase